LFSRLDEILGHYRRYTRKGLADVTEQASFEIVSLHYFDIFGVLPWWLINTLGGRKNFDAGMARLYDRLAVPLARKIESFVTPPVGKNLVMIARRPES